MPLTMADDQPDIGDARSDEQLWQSYIEGETEALELLVRRHSADLFWYLLLSTGQQQTAGRHFMATWELLARYRKPFVGFESFKEWLYATATQNAVPANHPEAMGLGELLDDVRRGAPVDRRAQIFFRITDMRRHLRQPFLLVTVAGLSMAGAARACNFPRERTHRFVQKAYRRLAHSREFRAAVSSAEDAP